MILFQRSASELMDPQADRKLLRQVREAALTVPGVQNVETLWIRKSGLEYFVDIHIEVDGEMTVSTGHQIGHDVKDRLLDQFQPIRDVLVHLEPFPHVAGDASTRTDSAILHSKGSIDA